MQYRLLGPLEAVDGDRPLNLGGRKQRALLAVLLLGANRVVTVEQIIDELWGECPPDTAANAVQVHVASLRRVLEPNRTGGGAASAVLVTRSPGYLINVDPESLDVLRFERLVDEAREAMDADPEAACARLREALALRRGPVLADVALLGPARGQVTRLEELHLAALEDRIDADLRLGRHGALVGELGALVAAHPLRERLRAQLMLALYRCGRQAEALEAYQAARRLLSEELGIDPSPELRELELVDPPPRPVARLGGPGRRGAGVGARRHRPVRTARRGVDGGERAVGRGSPPARGGAGRGRPARRQRHRPRRRRPGLAAPRRPRQGRRRVVPHRPRQQQRDVCQRGADHHRARAPPGRRGGRSAALASSTGSGTPSARNGSPLSRACPRSRRAPHEVRHRRQARARRARYQGYTTAAATTAAATFGGMTMAARTLRPRWSPRPWRRRAWSGSETTSIAA